VFIPAQRSAPESEAELSGPGSTVPA
jgi:hypothetical protein